MVAASRKRRKEIAAGKAKEMDYRKPKRCKGISRLFKGFKFQPVATKCSSMNGCGRGRSDMRRELLIRNY